MMQASLEKGGCYHRREH